MEQDCSENKHLPANLELFFEMVENARDGINITQNDYFKYVNKAFCDMLGYTREELCCTPASDLLAESDKDRMVKQHFDRMQGIGKYGLDHTTLIHKNGTEVAIEFNVTPITYQGENASFISIRDITERKRMQEKLEQSEHKYRNLIENAHDGIIITQFGKFKFVNRAFCNMLEYAEEELIECSFLKIVANEEKERLAEFHRLRMSGEKHQMIYESKGITKSGKVKYFEINTSYIDYNGHPATFIILRDHTDHRMMEESLRHSEKKYRELAEMLPQAVYELDAKGNPTYMNKAGLKIFGIDKGQKIDKAFDLFVPEDRPRMNKALEEESSRIFTDKNYTYSEPSEPTEFTAQRLDGSTFPVIIYGTAIVENGVVVGSRGLIIDISERKAMEEALRKSEEHYRQVIQSLQEGLFVLQDEKFLFVNDAIVDILGYTVEEMTGQHFSKVVPPECSEMAQQKNLGRKEGNSNSWSYEFTLLHKDGQTRIPVILSTNLTELDGKVAVVGTAKDITDRIKAEEEIKVAHKRLEEINRDLEQTIRERTKELTKANTQLLKLQKENLQSQFDVLKQQVNPHFLFNSLNVLTSLIRLEPELAEKFTEHLAKVYRYVLENKDNELVSLSTEINFLEAYIFLINIRFMDKIVVNIRIPEEKKNYQIIPLAMQLLIENAIKHNAMSKKSPLVIDIFIDETGNLNVVNNLQEREAHMTSTGVGLKNIQNRYRLLNNTVPVFEKSETHFTARIPLVAE